MSEIVYQYQFSSIQKDVRKDTILVNQRNLILSNLNEFRETNKLTDIILHVSDGSTEKIFNAHKLILSLTSRYFDRLFSGSFLESQREKIIINADPEIFEFVLKFIYGQPIEVLIDSIQFKLAESLHYFDVIGFDINFYLNKVTINNENFKDYLDLVSKIFPEGVPNDYLDKIAESINLETDLSEYSDELIISLLSNQNYHPQNINDAYNFIKDLVDQGHTPELFSLINYNLMSNEMKALFHQEFLNFYNRNGPIPHLSKNVRNYNVRNPDKQLFLLIREPGHDIGAISIRKIIFTFVYEFIDGDGEVWLGYIDNRFNPRQPGHRGDIVRISPSNIYPKNDENPQNILTIFYIY